MKRIFTLFAALLLAFSAFAQTPEEIVNRMDEVMDQHKNAGFSMYLDMKIPILGTFSTLTYSVGDKLRIESTVKGKAIISWIDGETEWTYTEDDNKIEIKKYNPSSDSESKDAELLDNITDGYDVTLKKQTADAWYFLCKKSRTNTDKDDPKTMDLVVSKENYYPKSLSAKVSGITVTIHDISFDVTEDMVTFNRANYPTATIVDHR